MKSSTILLFVLMLINNALAQNTGELESKYGIKVSYEYKLLEKLKKNDKYLLLTTAINNSGKDLYYAAKNGDGFITVEVENAKGLFNSDGTNTVGETTRFRSNQDQAIYVIKAGQSFKKEARVQVPKNIQPVFSVKYSNELKDLKDLDVNYFTEGSISGMWVSNCGNFQFNLSFQKTNDTVIVTQNVNGRQFVYEHKGNYFFQRKDNPGFTLSYNKDGSAFNYGGEDGVTCLWKRKEE